MDGAGEPARGVLPPRTAPIRFAAFTLDLDGCVLSKQDGVEVPLTRNEFALLREFVRHPGRVLSRDYLLDALAGKRADPYDRSVDVLVGRLRRKIEPDAKQPTLIVTALGQGYKFATAVAETARFPSPEAAVFASARAPPRLSIVVLPFANMSGDPEQDYFVDGVTESLTTGLTRIDGSFVIGRNTAFTFRGKAVDLKQIGRELNVRYVLEGSVQRTNQRMRVSVQLIDAESGAHVWAERFDKQLADLFDMQDEIVARLANALYAQLLAAEARRMERAPTPDSMDLCLRARASWHKGCVLEYLTEARRLYERALVLDPANAWGLVGIATVDTIIAQTFFPDDRVARLTAAEAAATAAVSLAPENAHAHMCLGFVRTYTDRVVQGIRECERALDLDRNLADAQGRIGGAKILLGLAAETETHIHEALRLSPRDTFVYGWCFFAGAANFFLGKEEEATAWLRRAIEANRNFPTSHFFLAAALSRIGRLSEARLEAQAGLALNPALTISRYRASTPSDNASVREGRGRFMDGLRIAGVPEG